METRLANARLAAAAAAVAAPVAAAPTSLARRIADSPRGELVTLPVLGSAWIELAGEATVNEIESIVFSEMRKLELAPTTLNAFTYENHRAAHTLARTVRDPDDHAKPFGTVAEWLAIDTDLINACAITYADVRERLDPIGSPNLSVGEFDEISAAVEKKNPVLLRSYGVAKLSLWLCTTDVRRATSPTPKYSDGASSPES